MHSPLFKRLIEQPAKHIEPSREAQREIIKYPVIVNGKIVRWESIK